MIDVKELSKTKVGGFCRGSSHPKSKLVEDDVLKILHLYDEGYTVASLARAAGVTPGAVWMILRGETWGWLTGIGREDLQPEPSGDVR